MKKTKKTFSLCALDYRIFQTLKELNKDGYFTNARGIYEIFTGHVTASTFSYLSTYMTLKNITSKKISMRLKLLLRKKYVGLIYNPDDEEVYYSLAPSGEIQLAKFTEKHSSPFKRFNANEKCNVVKIGK